MTEQEKRIKLAKAIGWTNHAVDSVHTWMPPKYSEYHKTFARSEIYLPDPFTDANDCHVLIKHLNGLGWNVQITHGRRGMAHVIFQQPTAGESYSWDGDNWMHGVCELALKVIE